MSSNEFPIKPPELGPPIDVGILPDMPPGRPVRPIPVLRKPITVRQPRWIDYSGQGNRLRQGGTLTGGQYLGAPYNSNLHNFVFTAPYSKSLGAVEGNQQPMPTGWIVALALGAWFLFGRR